MNTLPRFAIIGLVLCFACIFVGGAFAIISCNNSEKRIQLSENRDYNTQNIEEKSEKGQIELIAEQPKHYPGLEAVKISSDLPEQIKEYAGFTVSFNKDNRTPNYVAWELLGSEIVYGVDRSNNFWQDTDIEGCPAHYDYSYSGYDRGHLCPAADQKWSQEAMNDCFVMANMCPQDHSLNAGAWNTLENKERQWAQRDSALVIIAGPIYTPSDNQRIGDIGVRVPSAFFKVLLAPYIKNPRAIAFVYPNMTSPGNMQDYAMSVDNLEEITGFDFFSALPDDIENKVEAVYSFKEWNRPK